MISKAHRALLMVLGLFAALWFSGSSCGKGPVHPPPPEETDYVVYILNSYPGTLCYAYHTLTGEVNEFELPYNGPESGLAVSPDGKKLYMNPPGRIVELEPDSLTVIGEYTLPFATEFNNTLLSVSPDGRYLITSKSYSITIIDLSDYSILFRDTTQLYSNYYISDDSRYVYCAAYDSLQGTDFTTIDVQNSFTKHQQLLFGNGSFNDIKVSHDNTILYLVINVNYDNSLLRIYDRENDSILFEVLLCPGFCDMQLTNDENFVYLTQPGFGFWGVPGIDELKKYETHSPYEVETIKVEKSDTSNPDIALIPRYICKTPDGRRLIGIDETSNVFFDLNLQTDDFNGFTEIMGSPLLTAPICQRNP